MPSQNGKPKPIVLLPRFPDYTGAFAYRFGLELEHARIQAEMALVAPTKAKRAKRPPAKLRKG